jgi:catechol 2,3-dioxygenase-like lactoylglutathione lyase family enzyme
MSRVQLALNVEDLEASVAFYESLFNTRPHKRRPGYANFKVANPPLKLVLIEVPATERGTGASGALNHLGIEVDDALEVAARTKRLAAAGLNPYTQEQTNCCHAVQDKAWVSDPAGAPWEVYTITDDNPEAAQSPLVVDAGCIPGQVGTELPIEAVERSESSISGCACAEESEATSGSGEHCRSEDVIGWASVETCGAGSPAS